MGHLHHGPDQEQDQEQGRGCRHPHRHDMRRGRRHDRGRDRGREAPVIAPQRIGIPPPEEAAIGRWAWRGRKRRIAHGKVVLGAVQAGNAPTAVRPDLWGRHQTGLRNVAEAEQLRRQVDDRHPAVVVAVQFLSREAPSKPERVREQLTQSKALTVPCPPSGVDGLVEPVALVVVRKARRALEVAIVDR
jgi:hypothetical protein